VKIIIIFLVALMFGCDLASRPSHPSDEQLIQNFQRHEAEFNMLVEMSNQDSHVQRIASDFTWLQDNTGWPRPESELGFSRQRWDEYRRLFKELKIPGGLVRDPKPRPTTVMFFASSYGLVTGGSSKGYIYATEEQSPIVDSHELEQADMKNRHSVYKRLKGNWYIYYLAD
jgi:hypothetical protein